MARLHLDNVSLSFDVRKQGRISLKEFIVRGMFRHKRNPRMTVNALQNITLDLHEGDRLGIIGHNGAGKSTLLKLMAGVYPISHGRRNVAGRISSLFDVTLGFEPDASGWENIAYRGYLQGETPRSIRQKGQAIADFTELGDYLDMPIRYYSTGMVVRLGFAIATAVEPEILLIDEILSAGDLAFQEKARGRMLSMINDARIVVLASHDLKKLAELCQEIVWLDHGQIRAMGPAAEVIEAYEEQQAGMARQAA